MSAYMLVECIQTTEFNRFLRTRKIALSLLFVQGWEDQVLNATEHGHEYNVPHIWVHERDIHLIQFTDFTLDPIYPHQKLFNPYFVVVFLGDEQKESVFCFESHTKAEAFLSALRTEYSEFVEHYRQYVSIA